MFLYLVRSVILADGYVGGDHSHFQPSVSYNTLFPRPWLQITTKVGVGGAGEGRGGEGREVAQ